jgi:hypothetical protein
MLKLILLITTMVISMSSHAKDPNSPKVLLHSDFFEPSAQKSDNHHILGFFRIWLLDEMGKTVVQQLLEEKIGFDSKTALKTIAFMEKTIATVDNRTKTIYEQQQRLFVSQYNEGKSEHKKISDFRPEIFDKDSLIEADAAIQAKLAQVTDEYVNKLGSAIGDQQSANVRDLINEIRAYSHNKPPEDVEQIMKEAEEPLNYIINEKTLPQTDGNDVFSVIKKEL